jgi:hypothetical protein
LIGDELIEIGVGEHAARTLATMADTDVAQLTGRYVALERFGRAVELRCSLCSGLEATRYAGVGLTLAPLGQELLVDFTALAPLGQEPLIDFTAHVLGEVGEAHAKATPIFDGQVVVEPHSPPMFQEGAPIHALPISRAPSCVRPHGEVRCEQDRICEIDRTEAMILADHRRTAIAWV